MKTLVKKSFVVLGLLLGLTVAVFGQSKYTDLGNDDKTNLFKEEFETTGGGWWLGLDKTHSAKIENGYYCMETPIKTSFRIDTLLADAAPQSFEIELKLKLSSQNEVSYQQIMFGDIPSRFIVFGINAQGNFKIMLKGDERSKTLVQQNSQFIHTSISNKITIRKINKSLYFFVNEGLVFTSIADSLAQVRFAFELAGQSQAKIDFLRFSSVSFGDDVPKNVPPSVSWISPERSPITCNSASYTLNATVQSGQELLEVSVYQNDELIEQKIVQDLVFRSFKGFTYTINREADLHPGRNVFKIVARNASGKSVVPEMVIVNGETAQTAEKRIALVIGNSNYRNGPKLKNPSNDASLIAKTLEDMGFTVIKKINTAKTETEKAIQQFGSEMANYDVALFYFSGHGLQTDQGNYILPTDARLDKKTDLDNEAIKLENILKKFGQNPNGTGIVILDACRDNPFTFKDKTQTYAGFRSPYTPDGTIVAFSTSEGAVASDGSGQYGLFTEELVGQMKLKQPIEDVFKETRKQVQKRSSNSQSPQEWSKLVKGFYFRQ